jgi:hypothetical protein
MHQKTFDLGEKQREVRGGKPAPVLDELEPEAIGEGDGVSVVRERVAAVVLPVTTTRNPRSRGCIDGKNSARRTSYCVPPAPTSLYTQVTGAHNHRLVEHPRSGRESRPVQAVGPDRGGDHPNILPLDLNFTFNFILYTLLVSSRIST